MPLFRPDLVQPRDPAGFGLWLRGHYDEHKQFITLSLALTPPLTVPDYDLLAWSDDPSIMRFWLNAHASIHQIIDQAAGITSIDLAAVDLSNDEEFDIWQEDHALSHADERAFFGIN